MAIQFARCEYVSRSSGGNACRKASYNQREVVKCERTGEVFSFKERGGNVHHEILLPEGADSRFKNSSVLWNEAERCERRKDSQVAKEFVIAIPDDRQVTLEDRIELTRQFSNIFVGKGVAVQLDIHEPHDGEGNWHTHLLVTTRRFSEDGKSLCSLKARDLDPVVRKGTVVEADVWGEIWKDLQNAYFEEKGYDLRVDPIGIVAQEHLGPVRMRHHMNEALLRSQMLQKANEKLAQDPRSVLETITLNRAVFTWKDVESFLQKHVPFNEREGLVEKILDHEKIMPLYDKETGKGTGYFTTQEVRVEEEKLVRFADSIAKRNMSALHPKFVERGLEEKNLSSEQKEAYEHCVSSGVNLSIIQGRAGVGKSYVLESIRIAHEASGFRVLGLAPTHKVALDLKEDGFQEAKTCHAFLFAYKNNRGNLDSKNLDSKTLVVVDEASMLGTELSVELFHAIKTSGAKLILVGDGRQLSSVQRGGSFSLLAERYGAVTLQDVRRQTVDWQKVVSEALAEGHIKEAVHLFEENKAIYWNQTKEESLSDLLKDWSKESLRNFQGTQLILAQKNIDVDALNQGARDILCGQGHLGDLEITCMTQRGKLSFAEGDRIQLTKTDKAQGLMNGYFGTIEKINPKTKKPSILLDNNERKEVDPQSYDGLRHGYAATVYKAQGATLDHVYVLHSQTTTQSTSYVALTRQTNSLSLYVSKEETPTKAHLIRQMMRQDGNGSSLWFDTLKDIETRASEKTLTTHIKHGAEKVVTKVKDVFHKNEDFYNFEKPKDLSNKEVSLSSSKTLLSFPISSSQSKKAAEPISEELKREILGDEFYDKAHKKGIQQTQISPALKAVYEDWKHPAFGSNHSKANAIRTAFEKGLKLYGEKRALAYWESKKEELTRLFQQGLTKVDKELNSPHLSYLTDQWKDQAREFAKQDPTKALKLIQKLKDNAVDKRGHDLREKPLSGDKAGKKEFSTDHQNAIKATYLRFKALQSILKDNPKADPYFKKEFKRLGQELAQDKDFMKSLKHQYAKEAKIIERMVQEERSHSLNLGKGGYSL